MAGPGQGFVPVGVDSEVFSYFQAVAEGGDNQISTSDLHRCPFNTGGTVFSEETCRLLICMLDRDYDGKMGFNEFKELLTALQEWRETFAKMDKNRTGYIELQELQQAFAEFGYSLSPFTIAVVMRKFDVHNEGRLDMGGFINACIVVRSLTQQFQIRDASRSGTISIPYEDFISTTILF